MDLGLTAFVYIQPPSYHHEVNNFGSGTMFNIQGTRGVANPFNGKHEALPIPYLRPSYAANGGSAYAAACGFKGWSTLTRWTTQARASFSDTLNSKAWICFGTLWLAWDGTTTPTP
jgi:hypothetical protein